MILINHSDRAVVFGGTILIPAKPCEVDGSSAELKKLYPSLKEKFEAGTIQVASEEEAAEAETNLADQTIEQLKAYAAEKGIDITGLTKKDDIVAAIEKAGA